MNNQWIVLFDGTGNTPADQTNVSRLKDSLAGTPAWQREHVFYDSGVGTTFVGRFTGLAAGRGLSENVQEGYSFLCDRYQPGDEIYLFGFSRGAFTARSLVGLISKVGVLRGSDPQLIRAAYGIYRNKQVGFDAELVQDFRRDHSHPYAETRIRMVGVWDTVGALGMPWHLAAMPQGRDDFAWHNTELSALVDLAYHACAIDEHREDFEVTLWSKAQPQNTEVEQRWFPGAHCNVGGGYGLSDRLPNRPLWWMQDKARRAGLQIAPMANVGDDDFQFGIRDSFREFLGGTYAAVRRGERHYRRWRAGVNQVVDESAWRRWGSVDTYRPPFLQGLTPVAIRA